MAHSAEAHPAEVDHWLAQPGVNESRIRQRRLARTLWAIDDNGAWVYPVVQFDLAKVEGRDVLKQVRGLDRVLPALPTDLHPTAVAGFLLTPQEDLAIDGQPRTVRDWRGRSPRRFRT